MPATKIDQTTFDLGALQAEFTRGLYASAGVADLAVSTIREYVAEVPARVADVPARVQKGVTDVRESVKGIDFEPEVVRARAKKTFESIPNVASMPSVSETVEGLTALAKSRRTALEQRVTDLRGAREAVLSNVSAAAGTYEAARQARRVRRQPGPQGRAGREPGSGQGRGAGQGGGAGREAGRPEEARGPQARGPQARRGEEAGGTEEAGCSQACRADGDRCSQARRGEEADGPQARRAEGDHRGQARSGERRHGEARRRVSRGR